MIDAQFKTSLTGKIAESIGKELATLDDMSLVESHIERLKRLRQAGQITLKNYEFALGEALKNPVLSGQPVAWIRQELAITDSTLKIKHHWLKDHEDTGSTSHNEYTSSHVLIPGSTPINQQDYSGWHPVIGEDLTHFLTQLSPIDGRVIVKVETTQCYWHKLPWYGNQALLVRLTDSSWVNPELVIYYILHEQVLFRLNGTSPPLHELNTKVPIQLNTDNIADYLRFFCFFVRGEEGPFYLLEATDDPFFKRIEDQEGKSEIKPHIRTINYKEKDDDGHDVFEALVFYSNALFIAQFSIQSSGMIEMLTDTPIVADLPIKIEAPIV